MLPTAVVFSATTSDNSKLSDVNILELNDQIKDKKSKVSDLRKQIGVYEQNIKIKQSEANSLQNEISIIDDQYAKTNLDIQAAEDEIEQLTLEDKQVDLEIQEKEKEIGVQKDRLAEYVRQVYNNDQKSVLEIFILNENFSDFYDQVKYLEGTQEELNKSVGKIKLLREQLTAQKAGLEHSIQRQQELRQELADNQSQLEDQKNAKQNLISQSIMSADRFQKLLDDARNEQASIDSDLSSLENTVRDKLRLSNGASVALGWPVDPSRGISAYFHDPSYPFRYVFEHPAIDIRAYQSTPVRAAESGYVGKVRDGGMGYSYIMILHDKGLATVYGHISRIMVRQDTYVKKGDIIGLSGAMPGTPGAGPFTTGPHLHFEVRLNGIPVDPLKYLP